MRPAVSDGGRAQNSSIELTRHLHGSHYPLARLIQLIILLQTERCPNARQLAEICEVSRRTIYRDLAALADAGVTVLYRPDRQGYQLARSLFLQPPRIEEREALALLVLCRQWRPSADLGLSHDANRAMDKLVQSLPDPLRRGCWPRPKFWTTCRTAAPHRPHDRRSKTSSSPRWPSARRFGSGSAKAGPTRWRPRRWGSTG